MKHTVILADPPWQYRKWSGNRGSRTAESFYPTMRLAELTAMRPQIDEWAAPDCILFLWDHAPHHRRVWVGLNRSVGVQL